MSTAMMPSSAVDLTADSSPSLYEIYRLLALLQRQTGCTYCIELDGDALAVRLAVVLRDAEPDQQATLSGPMSFGEAYEFLTAYCLHVDGGHHAAN